MTLKRFFELWFPMLFVNRNLEKLKNTPDRSPELFALLAKQIRGIQSASMTLFTKIQKLEHQVEALQKGENPK